MPLFASFGLIIIAAAHANSRLAIKTQIEPKTSVSRMKKKNNEKSEKKCTNGPNDAKCVVWARSHHSHPQKPLLDIYIVPKNHKLVQKKKK